ncbi:MAG TPA: phytanoyl-CoA dioxygenase family protein [Pseudomonadales bacterium]|nr:phytanoyl-CoA dioxygenase family protein [Pseudomonadales bacterium]
MTNPTAFSLTRQQKNFFDTFGYLVLPGLLKGSIDEISSAFEQLYAQDDQEIVDWRHEAHYMKSRKVLLQFIERRPELSALLDHPVVDGIFSSLLGENYLYRASEGNIFTGDTYWHSDLYGAHFKYRHVKILLYLEPLDELSGAFRAIPGSHLFGDKFANLLERYVWKHEENYGLDKDQVPSITVPTQPGDALVFDYRLKHATSHTRNNRRMFSICASQRFDDEDLPILAELVNNFLPMTSGRVYHNDFLKNANETRLARIDQCLQAFNLIHDGKVGKPVA